jgi:hypothetical protein
MKLQLDNPQVIAAAGYWLERWHGKRHATRGRRRPKLTSPRNRVN